MATIVQRVTFDSYGDPIDVSIAATTAGNALIVGLKAADADQPFTITDSAAGAYASDHSQVVLNDTADLFIYRRFSVDGGVTYVRIDPPAAAPISGRIWEVSGVSVLGGIGQSSATDASISANVTTATANEALLSYNTIILDVTLTPLGGYTATPSSGSSYDFGLDQADAGAAGAKVVGGTISAVHSWTSIVATYGAAASGTIISPGIGAVSMPALALTMVELERVIDPGIGLLTMPALDPYISNDRPAPDTAIMTLLGLQPVVQQTGAPFAELQPALLQLTGLIPFLQRLKNVTPLLSSAAGDSSSIVPTLLWERTALPGIGAAEFQGRQPNLIAILAGSATAVVQPHNPLLLQGRQPNLVQFNGFTVTINLPRGIADVQGRSPSIRGFLTAFPGAGLLGGGTGLIGSIQGFAPTLGSRTIWADTDPAVSTTWTDT